MLPATNTAAKLKFLEKCSLKEDTFDGLCRVHQIPPLIALGMIVTESSGDYGVMRYEPGYPYTYKVKELAKQMGWTEATEKTLQQFSYGLIQIMGATARSYGFAKHPVELLHSDVNLAWGFHHLASLFQRYKSWPDAVAAYNYGHVAKKVFSTQYKNQAYVDRVYKNGMEFSGG